MENSFPWDDIFGGSKSILIYQKHNGCNLQSAPKISWELCLVYTMKYIVKRHHLYTIMFYLCHSFCIIIKSAIVVCITGKHCYGIYLFFVSWNVDPINMVHFHRSSYVIRVVVVFIWLNQRLFFIILRI